MNHSRSAEQGSALGSRVRRARSGPSSNADEDDQGERTPRASVVRENSGLSGHSSHQYDGESTTFLTRDFADHNPNANRLRHVKSSTVSFRQPSIRRRYGSTQPSPSPAPSRPWRFMESERRSVAIAPSTLGDDTASRKFSLAGPAPYESLNANMPYVDPGYTQLNPAYDQPSNARPVWGLAKPLPHVLRPGMVPTKEELRKEVAKQEDQDESIADLESGRIEPSLRPGKIASQLDELRRQREINLFEAYQQQRHGDSSPGYSPLMRPYKGSPANNNLKIPDLNSPYDEPIIEEEEYRHRASDPDLTGLTEAVSKVNRAKEQINETRIPYQDAIPLTAYDIEDDEIHNLHTYWSVVRLRFREPLAELLGVSFPIHRKEIHTNGLDHDSVYTGI